MSNTSGFIELCNRVVADCEAGKVDVTAAADKIYKRAAGHRFEEHAHPMLYKISDLAFDIAEDYQSVENNKVAWDTMVAVLDRYEAGDWDSTCWMLSAVYAEYDGKKVVHSYGVSVVRQNGKTTIETASDELNEVFHEMSDQVNAEQADERYLQNIAALVPETIAEYKRSVIEVAEHLTVHNTLG